MVSVFNRTLHCGALCLAVSLLGWANESWASPWTLPDDELALRVGYDIQMANEEFLQDGTQQVYPLRGQFFSSTLSMDVRYGVTSDLEVAARGSLRHSSYESDPLLLRLPESGSLQDTRGDIVDVEDTAMGVGDVVLATRYNVHKSWLLVTGELQAKIPTGYDSPGGLNVALGDGQVDLMPALLLGTYVDTTQSFLRVDLGYNVRLGGPGHQALVGVKAGQFVTQSFIMTVGVDLARTLFDGETYGESFVVRQPEVPFDEINADDVERIPLSLDRDAVRAEIGAIIRIKTVELVAGYSRVFSGRNTASLHSLNVGFATSIPSLTGDAPQPVAPAEPSDDEPREDVPSVPLLPLEEDVASPSSPQDVSRI